MTDPLTENALQAALDALTSRIPSPPSVALILGSGLGDFANELENSIVVNSKEIPHYPLSSVQGHSGRLVFGTVSSGERRSPPLLVFQGRIHFYERGELPPVVLPVQIARRLGATSLIVTNAAGGISPSLRPGGFMMLDDFLSMTFLRGPADKPSLQNDFRNADRRTYADPFDERFQQHFFEAARTLGVDLTRGVYCWLKGPTYETGAEIEMLRRCGADAVGMSTVPEIVMARQLGMRVAAISLITNMATGIQSHKLSHDEVTETARRVKPTFTALMREVLLRIGEESVGAQRSDTASSR